MKLTRRGRATITTLVASLAFLLPLTHPAVELVNQLPWNH